MLLNIWSKHQSLLILNAKIVDATQKSYQTKHHCEGSLRFGLGLGLGLGLTFNCVQSLKSRISKTLFLLIFNVFFGRNQQ